MMFLRETCGDKKERRLKNELWEALREQSENTELRSTCREPGIGRTRKMHKSMHYVLETLSSRSGSEKYFSKEDGRLCAGLWTWGSKGVGELTSKDKEKGNRTAITAGIHENCLGQLEKNVLHTWCLSPNEGQEVVLGEDVNIRGIFWKSLSNRDRSLSIPRRCDWRMGSSKRNSG